MTACYRCELPDPYHGQGDGIGSCDCPRCACCHAGPDDCDCDYVPDDAETITELNDSGDYLCNDLACSTRHARLARSAP